MSEALIKLVQDIRQKAAKANDRKIEYSRKERRKDSHEIQKITKHLEKELGQTRVLNQIEQLKQNLCTMLEQGDTNIDFLKVVNYCDTIIRNL